MSIHHTGPLNTKEKRNLLAELLNLLFQESGGQLGAHAYGQVYTEKNQFVPPTGEREFMVRLNGMTDGRDMSPEAKRVAEYLTGELPAGEKSRGQDVPSRLSMFDLTYDDTLGTNTTIPRYGRHEHLVFRLKEGVSLDAGLEQLITTAHDGVTDFAEKMKTHREADLYARHAGHLPEATIDNGTGEAHESKEHQL